MKKQLIKLTENDLHRIIKESVNNILTELDWKTYQNAARKWADRLKNNPSHPKRKSSVIGHERSKGDHDIHTDDRLRAFNHAAQNAFNRDYGFNVYGRDSKKGEYRMNPSFDNIGLKGYYDSIDTETRVPRDYMYDGKTKDGNRTKNTLKDTFHMDSFDGSDKYPNKRHETYMGYRNEINPNMDAVDPNMDRWDYMNARNKGNQEILDYINGEYDYFGGKWQKGGISIYGDDEETDVETFRPPFCYADGQLEEELGYDIFKMDAKAKNKIIAKDGMNLKPGKYKCNFNGKPCTLYIGINKFNRGPKIYGLCCYNDDKESIDYINSNIHY